MRKHHYATDRTGTVHVFHNPSRRNAWVHSHHRARARTLTQAQARAIMGGQIFLRLREQAHDHHITIPPAEE